MKRVLLCVILVLSVVCSFFLTVAASSDDSEIYTVRRAISPGLVYTQSKFQDVNGRLQSTFMFELDKQSETKIKLCFGKYVFGADTLSSMVKEQENEGYRVAAAVNADFFSMTTGIPMSLLMEEGKLVSSDDDRFGFGVKQDGSYIIGKPDMSFVLTKKTAGGQTIAQEALEDENLQAEQALQEQIQSAEQNLKEAENGVFTIEIDHLNKYPSVYGKYLLTDDFSATTKTQNASTEVILQKYVGKTENIAENEDLSKYYYYDGFYYLLDSVYPKLFQSENLLVTDVRRNTTDGEIPKGAYVLCLDESAFATEAVQFNVGDMFTLEISADEQWKDVNHAIGNGGRIVYNSMYTDESYDASIYNIQNPRTALGITDEGNLIVYAVDGRKTANSSGMTVKDLAQRLIDLGCVEAVNFDGGGSTTVYAALPGYHNATLQNKPSDTAERKISNSLMFINTAEKTGQFLSCRMYPEVNVLLSGTSFEIKELLGFDDNYYPVEITSDITYFTDNSSVKFEGNVGFATDNFGQHEIYAVVDGTAYPCGLVDIIENADSVSLNIDKKQFSVTDSAKINVGATYNKTDVACTLKSFTYNDGTLEKNYIPDDEFVLKTDRVEIDTLGNVKVLVPDEVITVTAHYGNQYDYVSFMANSSEQDTAKEENNEAPEITEYPETDYTDIDTHWAQQDILKCRELSLMKGENTVNGTIFRPEDNFSVAELCTVMARLLKYDLEEYSGFELPFEDTASIPSWAIPYIKAMYFNGKLDLIVRDNVIGAGSAVTRIDVMALCGTLCEETDKSYITFDDISYNGFEEKVRKISEIALQNKLISVNKALAQGVFKGYDDNTLRPTEPFTRAQAATVFVRLYDSVVNK